MTNPRDIIIRPLITEKTINAQETNNVVVFEVKKGTNKTHVKQAVEAIWNVKVERVNIVNCRPKTKRVGKYMGKTNAVRKAYVKLKEGNSIQILDK